jgi:D-alanyl-D-alanine carboxypeptidase
MPYGAIILTTVAVALLFVVVFLVVENSGPLITEEDLKENILAARQPYVLPVSEVDVPLRNWEVGEPKIKARAAIIYDLENDRILYDKNLAEKLPIASITKIISGLIVVEKMDLDEILVVPSEAINVTRENGAELFLKESLTVDGLLRLMMIQSNNDAAYTLALGSRFNFVGAMNALVIRLNMINTKFYDPAGFDDRGFSTVSDLINLVEYSLKYDYLWEIMGTRDATIVSEEGIIHNIRNTNKLLGQNLEIVGGKTGYTDVALENMLMMFEHNGARFATIVLGSDQRFLDTQELYDWVLRAYEL